MALIAPVVELVNFFEIKVSTKPEINGDINIHKLIPKIAKLKCTNIYTDIKPTIIPILTENIKSTCLLFKKLSNMTITQILNITLMNKISFE